MSPHEPPGYGYWKVAHDQIVMMAHAPSRLDVTLAVAFIFLDYAWGGDFRKVLYVFSDAQHDCLTSFA